MSTVQRMPEGLTWQACLGATLIAWAVVSNLVFGSTSRLGLATLTIAGTALILTTPVPADVAPMAVAVATTMVASTSNVRVSASMGLAATLTVVVASLTGDLDFGFAYLIGIGFGWMLGYMFLIQLRLLHREREAVVSRTAQAAVDERQRIAREVHDVIAHSLTITLLNLTGARRALQEDGDIDDAIEALADAERLGRQAMADIRHTVKVLGSGPGDLGAEQGSGPHAMGVPHDVRILSPEPGVGDITSLVADFQRANLEVLLQVRGDPAVVSGATGLAMYRIAQESLANFAKHAPTSRATVSIEIGARISIAICNAIPSTNAPTDYSANGSGLRGMIRRAELLGGTLSASAHEGTWSVTACFPITDSEPCIGLDSAGGQPNSYAKQVHSR